MDRVRTGSNLILSDLADARIPLRDGVRSDAHDGSDAEVDKRYVGVGYRSFAVVASVRLAFDVAVVANGITWMKWNKMCRENFWILIALALSWLRNESDEWLSTLGVR